MSEGLRRSIRDAYWRVGADAKAVGAAWYERWALDVAEAVIDRAVGKTGAVVMTVRATLAVRWFVGAIALSAVGEAAMRVMR
jgi:hypothetical protein